MKDLFTLNKLIFKYKVQLILGFLFIAAANFTKVYVVRFVGKGINVIEEVLKNSTSNSSDFINEILLYGALIIAFPVLGGILSFFQRQTIIVTSRKVEFDLKNKIFAQYQRLDLNFYKKNRTGDLMNRISEDVSHVRMYLGPGIMYPINMVTLFSILIIEMLNIDYVLTLYTLAPLPILSVLIYFISSKINQKSKEVQEEQSNLSSYVQDVFSGIRVIKSYHKEHVIQDAYGQNAEAYKKRAIELANIQAYFFPLMLIIIGLSQVLILFIGGARYISGQVDDIGTVAQFFMYLNLMIWPFTSLGWVSMVIQRAAASMKRINEFLQQTPEIQNPTNAPLELKGNIRFENVSFVYENTGIQALNNVTFELPAGKTLAIMGKTGSGKSTLAQLIPRLFDPTQGAVYLDNQPLTTLNVDALRKQIGFVPQEAFLFSDTLLQNITFGVDDATLEDTIAYAKKAHVHHNIMEFNEQYNTKVGERGITLSGGQKQRVSIARALIKEPKILIFDDSLSAVDTETEEEIMNNIREAAQQKTTLIVTHRVSSAKHADQILYLEEGEIIQMGTHAELIAQEGAYKELYLAQISEEVLD